MIENIIITAGGTSEPIDNVRRITNTGTGWLGSLIADAFARNPSVRRIFYICSPYAVRPQSERVTAVEIQTVSDLQTTVTNVLNEYRIDAVIHSMAVSDYTVRAVSTVEHIAGDLKQDDIESFNWENKLLQAMEHTDIRKSSGKLSSRMSSPLILLEQTPKILPLFRQSAPNAVIVGFKLLSEVSKEELLDTAFALLQRNCCDFVLANDGSQISGDRHVGYLINREKNILTFSTKQEIAEGIVNAVRRESDRQP